jgi:hypothetical protein
MKLRYHYKITLLDKNGQHFATINEYSYLPLHSFQAATQERLELSQIHGAFPKCKSISIQCCGFAFYPYVETAK